MLEGLMQQGFGQVRTRRQRLRIGELDADHQATSPQLRNVAPPIGQ